MHTLSKLDTCIVVLPELLLSSIVGNKKDSMWINVMKYCKAWHFCVHIPSLYWRFWKRVRKNVMMWKFHSMKMFVNGGVLWQCTQLFHFFGVGPDADQTVMDKRIANPYCIDINLCLSICIYLFYWFIYCHLYSAFSIVPCSKALYRLWDGEIQGHTGQPSVREIDTHTMYNQWATAPGQSLNYPRPKSITHLRTFSDNGVYVALQLFLVILVSDQWRRVLIPYSYRQAPWGLLHARGWLSRYTWDQQLYVVSEPWETHSPMLKARFLHLTNLVAQPGIEPPTSWLPGQRVTTRPRLIRMR